MKVLEDGKTASKFLVPEERRENLCVYNVWDDLTFEESTLMTCIYCRAMGPVFLFCLGRDTPEYFRVSSTKSEQFEAAAI